MPDEVREYIRAAQQAELRGDKPQAVELLKKAAMLVRSGGNYQRALQLLRHAQRLDGNQPELLDEIRRLEWLPDKPFLRAVDAEHETEEALAPLRALEESDRRMMVDRGPTLSDPELAAWCSFCCRPRTDVGDLVAGPAGAFICATCLRESARLLNLDSAPVPLLVAVPAPRPSAPSPPPPEPAKPAEPPDLVGQREAVELVQRGLDLGMGWILVVGPEGSGKTAFLRALERRGAGRYLSTAAALAEPWGDERLLVDGLDAANRGDQPILADALGRVRRAVIAVRGSALAPPLVIGSEAGDLPVYATRDLLLACGDALPPAVAEKIQLAASFRAPSSEELVEIARRLLVARAAELDLSDDLLQALAAEAARSPRGAHELRALLDRIPAGSWTLKSAPAAGALGAGGGRRRKRGKDEPPPHP
ncbi:MAG TPA: ClpX C4-type zinc finger protein [Myxococcaceae bacterium]|nr:ClpX C4-type zinc finger protein [Myxococcaceae bacterium]